MCCRCCCVKRHRLWQPWTVDPWFKMSALSFLSLAFRVCDWKACVMSKDRSRLRHILFPVRMYNHLIVTVVVPLAKLR